MTLRGIAFDTNLLGKPLPRRLMLLWMELSNLAVVVLPTVKDELLFKRPSPTEDERLLEIAKLESLALVERRWMVGSPRPRKVPEGHQPHTAVPNRNRRCPTGSGQLGNLAGPCDLAQCVVSASKDRRA